MPADVTYPPSASQPDSEFEMPFCGYCGARSVRFSTRGGWRESLLRFAGSVLYRCEGCGRRFAFAAVGHPHRHHQGGPGGARHRHAHRTPAHRARRDERRRRVLRVVWTVAAALLSFGLAAYMINRAERQAIEGPGPNAPIRRR